MWWTYVRQQKFIINFFLTWKSFANCVHWIFLFICSFFSSLHKSLRTLWKWIHQIWVTYVCTLVFTKCKWIIYFSKTENFAQLLFMSMIYIPSQKYSIVSCFIICARYVQILPSLGYSKKLLPKKINRLYYFFCAKCNIKKMPRRRNLTKSSSGRLNLMTKRSTRGRRKRKIYSARRATCLAVNAPLTLWRTLELL